MTKVKAPFCTINIISTTQNKHTNAAMHQITIPTSHITRLFKEQNKENGREKKQQTKYKKKLREMI